MSKLPEKTERAKPRRGLASGRERADDARRSSSPAGDRHHDEDTLRTMTLVTLALNGQAVFYVVRERRRIRSSRPGWLVIVSSIVDLSIIGTLALRGILMAPLAPSIVAGIFAAALVCMDQMKVWLFARFRMV